MKTAEHSIHDSIVIGASRATRRSRPRGPVATELGSAYFVAVLLRAGCCSVVFGVTVIAWELTNGQFSEYFAFSAASSLIVMALRGDLRLRMVPDLTSTLPRILTSVSIGAGLALLVSSAFGIWDVSGDVLVLQLGALFWAAMAGIWFGLRLLRRQWHAGALRSRAIIVGTGDLAMEFAVEISQRPNYGVDVVGLVGEPIEEPVVASFLGNIDALPALVDDLRVDRLIVMPGVSGDDHVLRALRWANTRAGMSVFVVPRFFDLGLGMDSVSPDRVRGYPLTQLDRVSHRETGLMAKRVFDAVAAGVVLLLLSPLLLLVAALVKLSDPSGPVFFRQQRFGRFGEPFLLLKFRSMRVAAKQTRERRGAEEQARITRIGSFIRKTSIDELPQLLNVMLGHMSLVGPRPEHSPFHEMYLESIPGYRDRLRMPVGLTGLAQIVGLRGETSIEQRAKYDNIYIDQWRFTWDIEILLKTVAAIVRADRYAEDENRVDRLISGGPG